MAVALVEGVIQRVFDLFQRVVDGAENCDQADSGDQDGNHRITTILVPFAQGVCYRGQMSDNMSHLAQVMFYKSLILAAWVGYKEAREAGAFKRLLIRFQSEWDKRRAKQPLMLTDQRPKS